MRGCGCGGFILTACLGAGALALAAGSFLGPPLFFGTGAAAACSGVFASSGVFGYCIIVSGAGGPSGSGASSTIVPPIAADSSCGATGSKDTDIPVFFNVFRQGVLH